MFILILAGSWLLLVRKGLHKNDSAPSSQLLLVPVIGAALAIPFGADLYHWLPDITILGLLVGFIAFDKYTNNDLEFEPQGWTYFRSKYASSMLIMPILVF